MYGDAFCTSQGKCFLIHDGYHLPLVYFEGEVEGSIIVYYANVAMFLSRDAYRSFTWGCELQGACKKTFSKGY